MDSQQELGLFINIDCVFFFLGSNIDCEVESQIHSYPAEILSLSSGGWHLETSLPVSPSCNTTTNHCLHHHHRHQHPSEDFPSSAQNILKLFGAQSQCSSCRSSNKPDLYLLFLYFIVLYFEFNFILFLADEDSPSKTTIRSSQ